MNILYQPPIDDVSSWAIYDAHPRYVVLGIVFEASGSLHISAHATRDLAAARVARTPGKSHTVRAALVQTEADN